MSASNDSESAPLAVEAYPVREGGTWHPRYTYLLFDPVAERAMLVSGAPETTAQRMLCEGTSYKRSSVMLNIRSGHLLPYDQQVSEGL